jgi:aconitate hydratase
MLKVGDRSYEIHRIDAIDGVERLPYTLRILLENVLRTAGDADVDAVAKWVATDEPSREINFSPGRAIHQDFTGVPAIVDLAAMRNAMADMTDDAAKINPLIPAELVIDHSVQVDEFASRFAFSRNVELEFERNRERYAFLRWGQGAFSDQRSCHLEQSCTGHTRYQPRCRGAEHIALTRSSARLSRR